MKHLKALFIIIIWSFFFVLTTVFLTLEFVLSQFKFKLQGKKSTRYFKTRSIFPHEQSKKSR
jgi:hypothetical protein